MDGIVKVLVCSFQSVSSDQFSLENDACRNSVTLFVVVLRNCVFCNIAPDVVTGFCVVFVVFLRYEYVIDPVIVPLFARIFGNLSVVVEKRVVEMAFQGCGRQVRCRFEVGVGIVYVVVGSFRSAKFFVASFTVVRNTAQVIEILAHVDKGHAVQFYL